MNVGEIFDVEDGRDFRRRRWVEFSTYDMGRWWDVRRVRWVWFDVFDTASLVGSLSEQPLG